jgi:hypothetical protein
MPLDERILGFSNRWYAEAMNHAETFVLEPSLTIRRIAAPFFLATKLEAFKGRGNGDFLLSHDLGDLLSVVDGRPELLEELRAQSNALRSYLSAEFSQLLSDPRSSTHFRDTCCPMMRVKHGFGPYWLPLENLRSCKNLNARP